ncbi:cell wall-active antibiotics response protein LiaF [Anoxybacillus sp. J5B_2022]|uniref:cell wall-active antibiotics response protein LiaF n=1 Tax=Anoxybacillus sp. J5B_2022 TaxID=3003246 RepID=UPI002285C6E2|nr:cell wall-active antibiotics response protein LiaF [Anoxybacillus sp. J5B_2022]MCZ0756935.1 cell wall-active antibiotics response protein LiaF [Anoxybacillus sp. J5B_2022]
MNQQKTTDYVSWVVLLALIVFAMEISFFHLGIVFSVLFSAGFIYIGRKKWHRKLGKIIFWIGCIGVVVHVFTMITVRFLLVALLFYAIIQYAQSKRHPAVIRPEMETSHAETELVFRQPLFQNMLFGRQKTPEHAYEWSDVNIQTGIGDTVIDLSYAVVPKGEAVIVVRGWIGNVHIFVPYEMEVSVVHSVLFGAVSIFSRETERLWNQTFIYQTPAYETAEQKLKIITSMAIGNVEVKRI